MSARQEVPLTPPKSSHPTQFLSRQQFTPVSLLAATLMDFPATVANKRLTAGLSPLDATLTKSTGVGAPSFDVPTLRPSDSSILGPLDLSFSLHALTNAPSRNPFILTSLQMPGGVGSCPPKSSSETLTSLPFHSADVRTLKRSDVQTAFGSVPLPLCHFRCAILSPPRSGDPPFLPPWRSS
jgi:hypothetical protein